MGFSKQYNKNLCYLSDKLHLFQSLFTYSSLSRSYAVPISTPPYSLISSTGSLFFCSKAYSSYLSFFPANGLSCVCHKPYPSSHSSPVLAFRRCSGRWNGYKSGNLYLFKCCAHGCFRSYSSSASESISKYKAMGVLDGLRPKVIQKQVSEIIDLARRDTGDLGSNLDSLKVRLTDASIIVVFRVLNREKVSALRFFNWIRCWQPELKSNSNICSLVIDNCGRLDDFVAMRELLNDFSSCGCCLSKMAFGFLKNGNEENSIWVIEMTQRVIDELREVGGSCYGSGVHSLVEMFCVLGSFDMAQFVIKKTEARRMIYYNVMMREMCRTCDYKGARDLLDGIKEERGAPSAQTYNYLIGSLLKNGKNADAIEVFQEMLDEDCPPDALTFDIFIHHLFKQGKFEAAFEFLEKMVARDLEPRLSTCAAFIKGLFSMQQYDEAYKYVVGLGGKTSRNACYTLLASLHRKRGNLVSAYNVVLEMMKKGLSPNLREYNKILKQLHKSGSKKLAMDLQEQFLLLNSTC